MPLAVKSHGCWPVPTLLMCGICRSSSASRAQNSGPQPGDFGHPSRRATDILLVANALMFGLQLLTKQGLTAWGIKVPCLRSMHR